jgi:hypothetical protein
MQLGRSCRLCRRNRSKIGAFTSVADATSSVVVDPPPFPVAPELVSPLLPLVR